MNKQGPNGIEWTDYSWNAVGGCEHECRWQMPDGSIAECYAETVAEGLARNSYPQGFAHHYWHPERLEEPLKVKEPAKIFLDSMSDLMGHWVPDGQIYAVLDIVRRANWHTFQLLTKNAPRLLKFKNYFPDNLWVGVSMPPTFFKGKKLQQSQQIAMFDSAMEVLRKLHHTAVRWVSFEPLSFDVVQLSLRGWPIDWAVIGAATNGAKTYQPDPEWVRKLLQHLDHRGVPVFFKGNLEWQPWREEFPPGRVIAASYTQASMFAGAAPE